MWYKIYMNESVKLIAENINWIKDIIVPFIAAIIGGGLAIWATKMSIDASIKQSKEERVIEKNQAYNNSINALKIELSENIHRAELSHNNLLIQFLSLSNYAWNNAKSYIEKIDKTTFKTLFDAYKYVSIINNVIQDTNTINQQSLIDNVSRLKNEALPKLKEAKKALDEINVGSVE